MNWDNPSLREFVWESLLIEGIHREPTRDELEAHAVFLASDGSVWNVLALQEAVAPGQPLRDKIGRNVRVGGYVAPRGSPHMREQLEHALNNTDPWSLHVAFEMLHPFMDGNGRTGRAVWAGAMIRAGENPFELSFLHRFYYQTLRAQETI